MTRLYSSLARAYHEMYQSIFDYQKEFSFYHRILKRHDCRSVLELGCGSGNLAPYFLDHGYDYLGLDLHREILSIARETEPRARFVTGDMRSLKLRRKFDAVIVTGRSLAYLTTNQDVMNTLRGIYRVLSRGGILAFDSFRAEDIFLDFKTRFSHSVRYENRRYRRRNETSFNLRTGWTWNWKATYTIEEKGKKKRVVEDHTALRAFTEDELRLFLELNRFKTLRVIRKGTFAFVAEKQ